MECPKEYRATASITFEFYANPEQIHEVALKEFEKILAEQAADKFRLKIRRTKKTGTRVIGEFELDDVLPYITTSEERREYVVNGRKYQVRMNSNRYFAFRASQCCVACGIEGKKMLLEQHPQDKSPHFNLYAVEDGKLVLMTKDHILAKSFGGEDRASNFQTLCCICNNMKGSHNLTLEAIGHLRKIYNKNKKHLNRKKLNALVNTERQKLILPQQELQNQKFTFAAACDLAIMENQYGHLTAFPIYDAINHENLTQIACVSKSTELPCKRLEGRKFFVKFDEKREYSLYEGFIQVG